MLQYPYVQCHSLEPLLPGPPLFKLPLKSVLINSFEHLIMSSLPLSYRSSAHLPIRPLLSPPPPAMESVCVVRLLLGVEGSAGPPLG